MKIGLLRIQNGPFEGIHYRFMRSIKIGRGENNTVRIVDPKVSRSHARIDTDENGFRIVDLDSKNGTLINGRTVKSRHLNSGDKILLGSTALLYDEKEVTGDAYRKPSLHISTSRKAMDTGRIDVSEMDPQGMGEEALKQRLRLLQRVNRTVSSEIDVRRAFEKVLDEIFDIFPADRGAILSLNQESGKLETTSSRVRVDDESSEDLLISQTIIDRVIEESVGLLIDDAVSDTQFSMSESVMLQNIRSALCVPLIQHGQIIGIIYLDVLGRTKAFRDADLELLVALAGPASMQIQNALYMNRLNRSYWDTIQVLAQAVDARDPYTIGHNLRVSRFAVAAATFMAWPEEKVHLVELAGILHDIGKIGISDTILLKKGPLSKAESRDMKRHPEIGAKMISGIEFLQPVIPFILYHHEMWDGNGYPYGLKGTDIPEEGRLMAVCDAFDAMLTSRPYRKGLNPESALQELVRKKSQQFDPEFVQALMSSWDPDLINQFPLGKGKERFFLSRSETNLVIPSIGIKS